MSINLTKQYDDLTDNYKKIEEFIKSSSYLSGAPLEVQEELHDWLRFIETQIRKITESKEPWDKLDYSTEIISAISQIHSDNNNYSEEFYKLLDKLELSCIKLQPTTIVEFLEKHKVNRLSFELNNLKKEILSIDSSLDINKENLLREIKEINDNTLDLFKKNKEKVEQENDEHISNITSVTHALLDNSTSTLNKLVSSKLNDINLAQSKALNNLKEQSDEEISQINKRIDDEINEFESKKKEITEILGEISNAYQASANTTQADKEKKSADNYRISGIIWLIITIFCSIWLFNDYIHFFGKPTGQVTSIDDVGFGWFTLRFMTITLLTAPSIYMLKESAYHRSKENLYRQRGTQLASIGAYLGEFDPAERAAMKKELAANFFSFYDGKADTSNVPDFIKNMNEAIKLAHAIKTPPASATDKKEQANS
ncbi:coiled-coil domain-containing protein [Vibrio fluvialis]